MRERLELYRMRFNSMIVRLKVRSEYRLMVRNLLFQFYDSPIKSLNRDCIILIVACFNSMIVRLKECITH